MSRHYYVKDFMFRALVYKHKLFVVQVYNIGKTKLVIKNVNRNFFVAVVRVTSFVYDGYWKLLVWL